MMREQVIFQCSFVLNIGPGEGEGVGQVNVYTLLSHRKKSLHDWFSRLLGITASDFRGRQWGGG